MLDAAGMPRDIPTFARVSWIFPETLCYLDHLESQNEVAREDAGDPELWRLA